MDIWEWTSQQLICNQNFKMLLKIWKCNCKLNFKIQSQMQTVDIQKITIDADVSFHGKFRAICKLKNWISKWFLVNWKRSRVYMRRICKLNFENALWRSGSDVDFEKPKKNEFWKCFLFVAPVKCISKFLNSRLLYGHLNS